MCPGFRHSSLLSILGRGGRQRYRSDSQGSVSRPASDKGAFFLTEPLDNHGWEWRCYMRDPDGYLIEVGQYTQMALDRFKNDAS
jgi:hypothetical protein